MIEYTGKNIRKWSRLGHCGAFGAAAEELPSVNENVVLLTADLCFYSGLDRFAAAYPDRFYNCGIAEQNMLGIAAGLAKEGFTPFVTTYATFASARCTDQVRVNMGYMRLPVKLVGLTSGLSVGILGATHISTEDIAIMNAIPNITILSPADCTAAVAVTLAAAQTEGPVYIRLTGTMNNPVVYKEEPDLRIGRANTLREGGDVAIIATGSMVDASLKAAALLEEQGIDCTVIDMHTIKPLDKAVIDANLNKKLLVTAEEHGAAGGLGGIVASHLAIKRNRPPHLIIGLPEAYPHAGDYAFMLDVCGLTPVKIAEKIQAVYGRGSL